MKKMFSLLMFSLASVNIFGQCQTTEDANNTPSSCKRSNSALGKEDNRISNATLLQADKWMAEIFTPVVNPALNKTTGLRGVWGGIVNITTDEGLIPYSFYSYMLELGCNKSHKLYEKNESGMVLKLRINSLAGIAQTCQHQEPVMINKSAEEKTVFEKVEGRQLYLLNQPTESDRYAGLYYYRKDKDETKHFVVAKKEVPLFLPVSIRDVLLTFKANYTARMNYEIKTYTALLNQSFESYLVSVDFASFEKNFSKEESEKAKAEYKKSYESGKEGYKKAATDNIYGKWIRTIDNYLQKSTAAQLSKPCIICCNYGFGADPITDDIFLETPSAGMQYVTINPVYNNKKNPATPQFVVIETSINAASAVSLKAKKVFEENVDFKKLEQLLTSGFAK